MDDIVNLIIANDSPSEISDAIKDALRQRAYDKIEEYQPIVAANLFNVDEE